MSIIYMHFLFIYDLLFRAGVELVVNFWAVSDVRTAVKQTQQNILKSKAGKSSMNPHKALNHV